MKMHDPILHVKGLSQFVDDLLEPDGLLHATVFTSPIPCGKITKLSYDNALRIPGIKAIFTSKDIPGENQVGNIIQDEELLAEETVSFIGQPIALLVGDNPTVVRKAKNKMSIEFIEDTPIFDPREAFKKGQLILPPRTFSMGNIDKAWSQCYTVVEGRVESGGQEHTYLETQSAMAMPTEDFGVKLYSATQSASVVQRIVARVLGIASHKVEVEVPRLGGAFGGKEDQATPWACLAALAAVRLKRPVKISLQRFEDMRYTGKRHPYSSDYKLGLTKGGKIIAYEVTYYQNAGAAADLSPAVLERTLFHTTNSYFFPHVKSTAISCRTNLPPNTAFRGFGAPQAMFVIESAIYHAAIKMRLDPSDIQKKNLLQNSQEFPYGMKVEDCQATNCWQNLESEFKIGELKTEIKQFNKTHRFQKQGSALMPICFGISFTNTGLNQASVLVHVYTDGSVSITTGAVEMGQGVKSKIQDIAVRIFSIAPERIKVEFTNTTRIANMSPTAASTGADMNGHATRIACERILTRLLENVKKNLAVKNVSCKNGFFQDQNTNTFLSWDKAVEKAYWDRVNLSEHAFYATPKIHFNKSTEKGRPFSYHVYGTAIVTVTVDCLRGTYKIDTVKVVHDAGTSLNPTIDLGQMEGGIVQGLGWMTMEDVLYNETGKLLTDSLTTYKVPDIQFAPDIQVRFLKDSVNPAGPFNSKAIGEPSFMYGIAAYFAILNAMQEFNPDIEIKFDAPFTPEKVLLNLYRQVRL